MHIFPKKNNDFCKKHIYFPYENLDFWRKGLYVFKKHTDLWKKRFITVLTLLFLGILYFRRKNNIFIYRIQNSKFSNKYGSPLHSRKREPLKTRETHISVLCVCVSICLIIFCRLCKSCLAQTFQSWSPRLYSLLLSGPPGNGFLGSLTRDVENE